MGTVGRVAVVPEDIGIAINTKHLAAITLNLGLANPHFIAFTLRSDPYILKQISKKGKGAIMTGLNLTIIKSLQLNLPPVKLQEKFEKRLQSISKNKKELVKQIDKSEQLFQSLLQRAFKGELVN